MYIIPCDISGYALGRELRYDPLIYPLEGIDLVEVPRIHHVGPARVGLDDMTVVNLYAEQAVSVGEMPMASRLLKLERKPKRKCVS